MFDRTNIRQVNKFGPTDTRLLRWWENRVIPQFKVSNYGTSKFWYVDMIRTAIAIDTKQVFYVSVLSTLGKHMFQLLFLFHSSYKSGKPTTPVTPKLQTKSTQWAAQCHDYESFNNKNMSLFMPKENFTKECIVKTFKIKLKTFTNKITIDFYYDSPTTNSLTLPTPYGNRKTKIFLAT